MRSVRWLSCSLATIALLTTGAFATAQVVDVSVCRAIEGQLERFACYEALGEESANAPAATTEVVPGAEGASATRSNTASATGTTESANTPSSNAAQSIAEQEDNMPDVDSFGRQDSARVVRGVDGEFELIGKVAELRHYVPNMWLITLENGQKWRQTTGRRYNLKVGDEVRIYPSGWGDNYRLSATKLTAFIQVQRVD